MRGDNGGELDLALGRREVDQLFEVELREFGLDVEEFRELLVVYATVKDDKLLVDVAHTKTVTTNPSQSRTQSCSGLVASTVHGVTADSADDGDEMGICIEPPEYVAGLRPLAPVGLRSRSRQRALANAYAGGP